MRSLIILALVLTVLGLGVRSAIAVTDLADPPQVPIKGTEGPDIRARIPPKAVEGPDIRNALAPRVPAGPGTR